MADFTTDLGLKKPLQSDFYNIADHNGNMDILDAAHSALQSCLSALSQDISALEGIGGALPHIDLGALRTQIQALQG